MTTKDENHGSLKLLQLVTDLRVIMTAVGLVAGGAGVKVFGDAGVTAAESMAIADSTSKAQIKPIDQKVSALIAILIEAYPEIKKSAQELARKNSDTREVINALEGDK